MVLLVVSTSTANAAPRPSTCGLSKLGNPFSITISDPNVVDGSEKGLAAQCNRNGQYQGTVSSVSGANGVYAMADTAGGHPASSITFSKTGVSWAFVDTDQSSPTYICSSNFWWGCSGPWTNVGF
jgi:hypothetical protein